MIAATRGPAAAGFFVGADIASDATGNGMPFPLAPIGFGSGALGHDVSHSSAHAPEMKPEQKQEQAVAPQREVAPKQEQGEDFGLGL